MDPRSARGTPTKDPRGADGRPRGPPAGLRGRPAGANAARERSRVQTLRLAFLELQRTLPSVPPDTKLSKLDVLLLATTYIAHLTRTLQEGDVGGQGSARQCDVLRSVRAEGYLHPVKVCIAPHSVLSLLYYSEKSPVLTVRAPTGQWYHTVIIIIIIIIIISVFMFHKLSNTFMTESDPFSFTQPHFVCLQ
uniref:Transcription factor 24 n=1 Tax=Scleropages formosus TaxID=113540 RepID=A0A8C9WS86_SCLFO